MRVSIEKSTGDLIESQGGGNTQKDLDILRDNALVSGYQEKNIEVKFIEDSELSSLIEQTNLSDSKYVAKKQKEKDKKDELANNPLANATFEQAETWVDNNVTDLDSAKEAMKTIVKLLIART